MYGIVDCNNFYASCERVFNPKLHNKPIIVLSNNDGCVIARSNEVKRLGIKMGEPAFKISSLIKKYNIKVFSTNFALYGDMSQRVMNIIAESIPKIEIYSIDEAFLDLHGFNYLEIVELGHSLRKKILKYTGLPVSIGIGQTKTLAKIANHISKKNKKYKGVFMINNDNQDVVLANIPVKKIWGIGFKMESFFKYYGVYTAKDLKEISTTWIRNRRSIVEERTIKELRGIPCYTIDSHPLNKKSICTSRTFGEMITSYTDLKSSIAMYTARCAEKLRIQNSCAKFAHVFISTNPYGQKNKQYACYQVVNFPVETNDTGEMLTYILKILKKIFKEGYQYKKAGVVLGGIIPDTHVQTNLFDSIDRKKSLKIMHTIDSINKKIGRDSIRYACQGYYRKWTLKQEQLSPCYTTRWLDILTINI
tara:strand:+ start:9684 stop:10943 length:1260 start_codon:yes stop_codon:yes gene_type:complete